jgi:hypothetical protein
VALPARGATVRCRAPAGNWASDHLRSSTWRPKYATAGRNRPLWGCAVVSTSLELLAFEPPAEYPWPREGAGSVASARATCDPCWLASVHFHASEIPAERVLRHTVDGIQISTPNGSVWETDVLAHELHRSGVTPSCGAATSTPIRGWTTCRAASSTGTAGASPPTRLRAPATLGHDFTMLCPNVLQGRPPRLSTRPRLRRRRDRGAGDRLAR